MLPLTFCEWKCWQRKILSDVQPSFSCRWLQKPKVTFLLITKIRISFEKLWPRFCIWGRLKRCLLFLLRKMALFRTWPLWFPQKVFFSWKRSYFVQMSRCVFFFYFYVGYLYIYIRRFIPILFCHLYMNVSYRFRLKSSTVGFKDVGLTVPGWMARSWTPGVRCSRRVPSTGGPPCVGCVRWFRMRRCHGLEEVFAHVFLDMFISKVFEGVHHHLSGQEVWWNTVKRGCVLEHFGSDFLKQLISAGVLKQSVFLGSYTVSTLQHYLCIAELYIF